MTLINRNLLAALAALISTAWLGPIDVVRAGEAPSMTVRFSDLDLNRAADVRVLYGRITVAAEQVCGPELVTGSRLPQPAWRRCVAEAVNSAVAQLDRPALNAYHHSHTAADSDRKS